MTLLDWLVVATVAAIVLVLLDGLRRKWVERRNRVIMKLDRNLPQEEIDLDLIPNSELPNGGARTLTREADPSPAQQRKRNFKLKDGRDQRGNDQGQGTFVPPVLMDPVEVEEESIEHANVYVKAEEPSALTQDDFIDDDLPPEVLAGLDTSFDEDDVATAPHGESNPEEESEAESEEEEDDETMLESLDDDDEFDDLEVDEEEEDEVEEDDEDQDDEDDEDDEEQEQFEPEFDDELTAELNALDEQEQESASVDVDDYEPVARDGESDSEDADGRLANPDELDEESDELSDDEYGEYEDGEYGEDYENEPTLLEGAYRKAASHFQRPQEPEAPRIEPGFGDAPSEEVESAEDFSSAFDDKLMDEILGQEQAEINAWRAQSVTQRNAPAAEPAPAPEKPKPRVETPPSKIQPTFAAPDEEDEVQDDGIPDMDIVPDDDYENVAAVQEPQPKPATKVKEKKEPKEPRKGFWESVTGKAPGKPAVKPVAPKVNQVDMFHEDPVEEAEPAPEPGPQEVIIINVMAKPGQYFRGDELLPLVQRYGLRLGNMSIFHRHADHTATGPVMFSMANMVKPGTFSLNNIEEFVTPGVSFFVQMPNKFGNMKSFEQMLATCEGIKQTLGGDLKDERRSVFTRQTIEHCRQRIRDFELSLLAKK